MALAPHTLLRRWILAVFLTVAPLITRGEPLITEFMAANSATLADDDGSYSDWIEIYNPDPTPVDLTSWCLTDSAANLTKWRFPAVTLPAGGYLVVFASNKDRRDPERTLHTNFALSAAGEYLALVRPDGSVAHDYAPAYPEQEDDFSYGIPLAADGTPGLPGYFHTPTPGQPNTVAGGEVLGEQVSFSRESGPFTSAFSLELWGAAAGQHIRYVTATSADAEGKLPEPTASSALYTRPLLIGASVVVRAAVFSDDGALRGEVSTVAFTQLAPDLATFSSRLPVLVLDTLGSGELSKDGIDHPSWLHVYAPQGDGAATFASEPQQTMPLTSAVRGASSADFPKRSYTLKLASARDSDEPSPLLDLPAYEKWALIGPWAFDLGYVNNAFMYALSNELGRWAPRTRFVEVFHNGGAALEASDYAGIYVLTDRVEIGEGRVEIDKVSSKDITGGYLLKIDVKDADEFGWRATLMPRTSESSIIVASPKADELSTAQRDYIVDYIRRFEEALVADEASGWGRRTYLDFIDRASWVDYHILNTFAANPDAFERSTYFTKDRGGKLVAGPIWDFDRALGSYWDSRSFRWEVWSGVGATDVWNHGWWDLLARDPEFMQDWIDRWQSLRQSTLSESALATLADSLTGQIGEAAAARDRNRWPDNANPFGNYAGQAERMRSWVQLRAEWIDSQFLAAPEVGSDGANLVFTAPEGAQLVYTLDGSDPRSLGGAIAPGALTSAKALVVPSTSNVHVRSYRAELKDTFPGSPWSSAVGGMESSPLTPRARLVNISSRAMVGSGENALITGVVVADSTAKRYLARGIGPGLAAFGTTGVVPDPQLSIVAADGVEIYRNNGWETAPDAARIPAYSRQVGAFALASGSLDAAIVSEVAGGSYSIQLTTPKDQPGIGLAELYELDDHGRTVNLSTRARVGTGDAVLIGGFVVQGPAYKRMLIRAVGPTLGAFGVGDALADPQLTLYSAGEVVAASDRWEESNGSAIAAASRVSGAFSLASGSQDAALLITLKPGAYTVEIKGKGDAEGVALLEIYEVP